MIAATSVGAAEPEPWVWSQANDNGVRLESQALGERFHGRYTATGPDAAILMVATFLYNEVTTLQLPEAMLPPARTQFGKEPVTGAGGIEFGTASLGAFASMKCGQRRCLTALVHDLAGQMTVHDADEVRDAGTRLFPDSTPNPVPGAREYVVGVGLVDGVNEVAAKLHFDSDEECERERARINALLRDKYGVFEATHSSATFFGQCDERGIPERVRRFVALPIHA